MERVTQIRNFIAENYLFGPSDQIRDDESFLESGILDSTGVLQLVDFLEQTFLIRVENEEVTPNNLDSIEKIGAYLEFKIDGHRNPAEAAFESSPSGVNS